MKNIINIPVPSYPWAPITSPLKFAFDEEEKVWLDEDYNFMTPETIRRYKLQNIAKVAPYMAPTTVGKDILRPVCRFLLYETLFDDYVELMPLDELKIFRDRVIEVMIGDDPRHDEIGILRQVASARKEWKANGMPQFWIKRHANNFYKFVTYGIMEETPFKYSHTFPPLYRFLMIRSHSIGQQAYVDMIDPATRYALPNHIYHHPAFHRLLEIQSIIIAIQNDYGSIRKELATANEHLNIILVLQHEFKLSFEKALEEGLRIHDEFVKEFDSIASCLPDFSPYQQEAENYVHHIKLMITCLNDWYYTSGTMRYQQEGFATPKYGEEGEKPLDMELKHDYRTN